MRLNSIKVLLSIASLLLLAFSSPSVRAAEPAVRKGEVRFEPVVNEESVVPAPFRLSSQSFAFEQQPVAQLDSAVTKSLVTFPSPVKTAEENNNTVRCEYFCPTSPGKHPACVVLHFMGGDFLLARVFANHLAHQGVAALFIQMPYYGDRRTPGSKARMVSVNPQETVAGMTQAVKDIRFAAAWLAAQEEVDPQQLGIFGISLGGITASLTAAAEPRFTKICPLLAGGDLSSVVRDSKERHLAAARDRWTAQGNSLDGLVELMKTIDPCSYGLCQPGRKVLMLNATRDEVIPRGCTDRLWEAFGKPPIVWYECGHYTALLHMFDALAQVGEFFKPAAAMGN